MLKYILISLVINLIITAYAQDQCCRGETWGHCPCKDTPSEDGHNICCGYEQACAAGGGCIKKGVMEQTLLDLQNSISENKCDYYNLLEEKFQCGTSAYTTSFANQYCQLYLVDQHKFENKEFQNQLRRCLQSEMNIYLEKNYKEKGSLTCNEIKENGLDAHLNCFVRPSQSQLKLSYCTLLPADRWLMVYLSIFKVFSSSPVGGVSFYNCKTNSLNNTFNKPMKEYQGDWKIIQNNYLANKQKIYSAELEVNNFVKKSRIYLDQNFITVFNRMRRRELQQDTSDLKTFRYSSKFVIIKGVLDEMNFILQNNLKLNNLQMVDAYEMTDSLNQDDKFNSYIGLGVKNNILDKLYLSGQIKHKKFYFDSQDQLIIGNEPMVNKQLSFCTTVDHEASWGCQVDNLFLSDKNLKDKLRRKYEQSLKNETKDKNITNITDNKKPTTLQQTPGYSTRKPYHYTETTDLLIEEQLRQSQNVTQKKLNFTLLFSNNLDQYLYFSSHSERYFEFFYNDYLGDEQKNCISYLTPMMTYQIFCNKSLNQSDLPNITLQINNYAYLITSDIMFQYNETTEYYELMAQFQVIGMNKEEVYVGIEFFQNSILVFNQEEKKIQFYGGLKYKLFDIEPKSPGKWWISLVVLFILILIGASVYVWWNFYRKEEEKGLQKLENENPSIINANNSNQNVQYKSINSQDANDQENVPLKKEENITGFRESNISIYSQDPNSINSNTNQQNKINI